MDNDKSDIVKGSVEGVITADKIAEEITTILQLDIIFSVEIIPRDPRINCKTGNWKANAVLVINNKIKSKYLSIDHKGSTISAPNFTKKLMAAGTSTHHENINPIKNNKTEPMKAGKRRLFSLLVNPGDINKIIW